MGGCCAGEALPTKAWSPADGANLKILETLGSEEATQSHGPSLFPVCYEVGH